MRDEVAASVRRSDGLRIRLLGAPEVVLHGRPLTRLNSNKAHALLFFLAVTGRMHTRSTLAGLLWGDMPEAAARSNLRKVFQQLRDTIPAHMRIERDIVGLVDREDRWIDVVEFVDLLNAVTPSEASGSLQRAISLYRGDFLQGFHVRDAPDFESWVLSEQERFRAMVVSGLTKLAETHAGLGDLDAAVVRIRQSLAIEPWREDAPRRLMAWLVQSGQRSAALVQYEICRRELATELAVEPDEETTFLYEQIRHGELKARALRATYPTDGRPHGPAFPRGATQAENPIREYFVGREAQLVRLAGFLEQALSQGGQVAFVSGEAGWGKTRLLMEFADRAQELHPDLIVLSGTCTGYAETGDPYLPFREILRTLAGDTEQGRAAGSISRTQALRVWRFLPRVVDALLMHGQHFLDVLVPKELLLNRVTAHDGIAEAQLKRLRELASRENSVTDQGRIFEEVADVLNYLSQEQPLLLVLDDLHWADPSSLGLLFHLARRLGETSIFILGAYRPEEVSLGREGKEHPLAGVLAEFERLFGDISINLSQDEERGLGFVNALLDTEPNSFGEEFRLRLAEKTRGHPLFTVEALRDMREQKQLCRDDSGRWVESSSLSWEALPRRVEGVIQRRVGRLDPMLRNALVAASAEGEEFTAEVVARVCNIPESKMIGILSGELARRHRLIRANTVRWLGQKRFSSYLFSHHLIQAYLYDNLDPVERTYLHEAVGNALEELYQGQTEGIVVHLARHFREAGHLVRAVDYLKQAGDAAARVYANTEAIALYEQGIDLAQRMQSGSDDLLLLYTRLGRALELESQFERVLRTYEGMEELARERGDPRMELASLIARTTIRAVPTAVHDPEQAQTLGSRALTVAQELGDRAAEAKILWSLSLSYYFSHELAEAVECGERSLALARELGMREQMAQTLNDLGGFIYLYSGRLETAREALRAASALWRDLRNAPMLADSLGGLCIAHVYAGDFSQGVECSEEAFQISRSIENVWGQSYSRWTIGDAFAERGEVSKAIETMEACVRLGKRAGFLASQTYTPVRLALVYMEMGVLDKAEQLVQEALALSRKHLPAHMVLGLGVLARLQLLTGDLAGARASIREARNNPHRESWLIFFCPVLLAEAELALRAGDPSTALSVTDDLGNRLRSYGMRLLLPEALYLRGKVLLSMGQDRAAYDCFLEAQAAAEAIGSRRVSWRVFLSLSHLESDPAMARLLLHRARSDVEFVIAQLHAEHADLRRRFLVQSGAQAVLKGSS